MSSYETIPFTKLIKQQNSRNYITLKLHFSDFNKNIILTISSKNNETK